MPLLLLKTDKRGRSVDPERRLRMPFLILSLLDNFMALIF